MNIDNITDNEEMSTVDDRLPKYYKGYDMDVLITKLDNNEFLTEEEEDIICEAQHIYYKKHFKEVDAKMEKEIQEAKANGKIVMRHIEPGFRKQNNREKE